MFSERRVSIWIIMLALPAIFIMGCQKTVFVTDGVYDGNLGGLVGADAICQAEAAAAGLPGVFKAWLSDDVEGPDTRFVKSTVPYTKINSALVAKSWDDLMVGSLYWPIDRTATGVRLPVDTYAWTSTYPDGSPVVGPGGAGNCANWTAKALVAAGKGSTSEVTGRWTYSPGDYAPCYLEYHLYCFQQ